LRANHQMSSLESTEKKSKLSFPSFFLGEIPSLEDPEGALTAEQAFQLGYEAGAETAVTHLNEYWLARLAANRNNASRTYTELTNRIDWLFDIFGGLTPNPTGETP
jgi:hypothetical protein